MNNSVFTLISNSKPIFDSITIDHVGMLLMIDKYHEWIGIYTIAPFDMTIEIVSI